MFGDPLQGAWEVGVGTWIAQVLLGRDWLSVLSNPQKIVHLFLY
jgi:hypothetical protein